jgi:hypothetical protein
MDAVAQSSRAPKQTFSRHIVELQIAELKDRLTTLKAGSALSSNVSGIDDSQLRVVLADFGTAWAVAQEETWREAAPKQQNRVK